MKRVLLCLCGLTPQIITETLYVLSVEQNPSWKPDEIHIITTGSGKLLIKEKLLHPSQGRFYKLCEEFGLANISFNSSNLHCPENTEEEILDIRNEEENRKMADFILAVVHKLCTDSNNQVHASLAGGRKTMSFYLGMAMQFFAKEIDTMSHVLVNPPFENHPDFYYPPKVPQEYTFFNSITGQPYTLSSSKARISLAYIPFVRLGDYLPRKKDRPVSFTQEIQKVQQTIENRRKEPELIFETSDLCLNIDGLKVYFTPVEAAIYYQFVRSKLECERNINCQDCFDCFITPYDLSIKELEAFLINRWGSFSIRLDSILDRLKTKTDMRQWFLQNRSRINRKIKNLDSTGWASIQSKGNYGSRTYGIMLDKKQIDMH